MRLPKGPWPRLGAFALMAGMTLLLSGCDVLSSPQNTFAPEGQVAEDQKWLFLFVMWPALVIGILVFGLLGWALFRYRERSPDAPPPAQVHGNTTLEIIWTILPIILLAVIAVPTLYYVFHLGRAPSDDAFKVNVLAQRFSWEFTYPDVTDASGDPLITDNELYVPIGREVGVYLDSVDVIHSFWMPKLAGKLDVIPGQTNRMWFKADSPGSFSAQCAEFCGTGHAGMRFRVIAMTQEDFDAWARDRASAVASEKRERLETVRAAVDGGATLEGFRRLEEAARLAEVRG